MEYRPDQNGQPEVIDPVITEEDRIFTARKRELVFFVLMTITGLCLCNFIIFGGFNLGFAMAAVLGILFTAGYLLSAGCKPTVYSMTLLLLSAGIVAGFARSDDAFVKFVMICFLFFSVNLGFCLTAGQNLRKPGSVSSLLDVFRAAFRFSFGKIGFGIRGLSSAFRRNEKTSRKGGAFLLGLGICVPLLAIVISLLVRADAAFDGLVALLPKFELKEWYVTILLGVPLSFLLFAKGVSLKHAPHQTGKARERKGISAITINTVLIALCVVYVAYLVSQLAYFAGGFAKILPEGYTMAEYARRGFFEMAWLCFINLNVIILSLGLVRKEKAAPLVTRLLCLFVGLTTLFLVATASAKMFMYIDAYGLTRLRVLTQIIMLFLGFVTAVLIAWLFIPKLPYMKVILVVALLIGGATIWIDVDTQVANYNVNAYLSGKLETVDVSHLFSLGDEAVGPMQRLKAEAPDDQVRLEAQRWLSHFEAEEDTDFRGWNYTKHNVAKYLPKKK